MTTLGNHIRLAYQLHVELTKCTTCLQLFGKKLKPSLTSVSLHEGIISDGQAKGSNRARMRCKSSALTITLH
jgi:hypothetical protein